MEQSATRDWGLLLTSNISEEDQVLPFSSVIQLTWSCLFRPSVYTELCNSFAYKLCKVPPQLCDGSTIILKFSSTSRLNTCMMSQAANCASCLCCAVGHAISSSPADGKQCTKLLYYWHYPTLAPPGGLTLHVENLLNSSFRINLLCLKDLVPFSYIYIYPTKEPSLNR